jgi:hypothetical protein
MFQVESSLRDLLADLDYDLHKSIERDESTGENRYPEIAADFIQTMKYFEEI